MEQKSIWFVWITVTVVFLSTIDAEVCFRRFIPKKQGCRSRMKKHFRSAEACCRQNKASGYAFVEDRIGKKLFSCRPCTQLPHQSNVIQNFIPSSGVHETTIREPVNPEWGPWSDWTACSASCMAGIQERRRSCNLANRCKGLSVQTKSCSVLAYCPVDGNWAPWYPWRSCSKSCGGGIQTRFRRCNNPPPMNDGKYCPGNSTSTRSCNERKCPVDGHWTEWNAFTQCTATCGPGVKVRLRQCNNPPPAYGGHYCKNAPFEHKKCQERLCPIDGGWTLWSSWSRLTVTCGEGVSKRTRVCNSPKPKHNGRPCEGDSEQFKTINSSKPCPVNGGWSKWTSYGECQAAACQKGYQLRSRTCTNPRPQHGGRYCAGNQIDKQECVNHVDCVKVNGGWCDWSEWGVCSLDCGDIDDISFQKRIRHCDCPAPKNGGSDCSGVRFETRNCEIKPCNHTTFDDNINTEEMKDLEFVLRSDTEDDKIVIDETTTGQIQPTTATPTRPSAGVRVVPVGGAAAAGSGNGPTNKPETGSGCTSAGSGDGSDGLCDQEPEDSEANKDEDMTEMKTNFLNY
ncbi:properdin-like [Tubulanus polymorphus]|uniref:properdin-like n=1 Tax=Tubulanus polymorphus TaxID=672921 RepID=UPI003DA52B87